MTVREARVMPALLPAQSRETPGQCCASCQRKRDAGVRILRCFPVLETVSDARRSPCRRVITTNYAISAPRRLLIGRPSPTTSGRIVRRAGHCRRRERLIAASIPGTDRRAASRGRPRFLPDSGFPPLPTLGWEPSCRSDNPHLSTMSRGCNHRAICDRYAGRGHRPGAR